jgi:rhodanese-related sulfurtransferase
LSGTLSFTVEKLAKLIGTPSAPSLVDVRLEEDFILDPRILPASTRARHTDAARLPPKFEGGFVVVICQKGAKLSHGFAAQLRLRGIDAVSLNGGFEAWRDLALPLIPLSTIPSDSEGRMHSWVTRHRPKIDRIACPWLIRRFVNASAEFMFVPPEHVDGVAERFGATAFDMPTGKWTHEGERCTFDTMLQVFELKTPALLHLARIVRAADTDQLQNEPEAAGLLAISLGLSRQYSDDLAQLEAGMAIYDAFYRWCRDATEEAHNWPAQKPAAP